MLNDFNENERNRLSEKVVKDAAEKWAKLKEEMSDEPPYKYVP